MKKAVAMTAFERPQILAETLDGLIANDPEGWKLFISVDPGDRKVLGVLKDKLLEESGPWRQWRMEAVCKINAMGLGPDKNPLQAMEMAFGAGADVVLYLQDDTLLSPDALALVDWFAALRNVEDYFCLWLFNYETTPEQPLDIWESRGEGARLSRGFGSRFYSLAFACTRTQFERFFKPRWFTDPRGFDWSLSGWVDGRYLPQQKALVPAYSRCQHIGREGGTYTTEWYWDWMFKDHQWCRIAPGGAFRLMRRPE